MKGKFSKTQLRIMTLLGMIALLMIGGVFLLRFSEADAPSSGVPVEQHEKIRAARASLNPYFNREINIGGSGDEILTGVFTDGSKIYVLGTTTSTDRDFDGEGGVFLATVEPDGKTCGFFQYGSGGDSLECARLCEDGFLLGVNSPNGSSLLSVGFDGRETSRIDTSGVSGEQIADVKCYASYIVVVTSVKNTSVDSLNLKARVFDYALELKAERIFTHACSLEYIDTFETESGYVTVVNLTSPLINRMAFIDWGLLKQGLIYDVDLAAAGGYRCEAVMPYAYGFFAVVVDSDNLCDGITVSAELELHSRVYLKQSSVSGARAFYTPDGYYCLMKRGENLSSMIVLDAGLQYKKTVPQFSSVSEVCSHALYRSSAVFCARDLNGLRILTETDGEIVSDVTFGPPSAANVQAVNIGGRLVVVCDMSGTCSDCPSSFGGRDIWLAFMY